MVTLHFNAGCPDGQPHTVAGVFGQKTVLRYGLAIILRQQAGATRRQIHADEPKGRPLVGFTTDSPAWWALVDLRFTPSTVRRGLIHAGILIR